MRVLFVCTGNTCRSAMAEALLSQMALRFDLPQIQAESAGIYADPGMPASFGAICAMEERGIDLHIHRATALNKDRIDEAGLILCMTKGHVRAVLQKNLAAAEKTFTLLGYAGGEGDIDDPFGGDAQEYERVSDMIELAVAAMLMKLYPGKAKEIEEAYSQEE